MAQSDFGRILSKTEVQLKRATDALNQTKFFAEQGNMVVAFSRAFDFEGIMEKAVLLARVMPAYTGHPNAADLSERLICETVPVEMGFLEPGWFCLQIPALLPKKEQGSASYIRGVLYPAMRRFFADKPPVSYPDCVLIFRHIYDWNRPERAWRDHDNIEVNMVADIITLYLLPDDAPRHCAHYYCSAAGDQDSTIVYVVPRSELADWIHAEKNGDLEGVMMYETYPAAAKKDV